MLTLRARAAGFRSRLPPRRYGLPTSQRKRNFVTVQQLTEGFLDLAIALPLPPEWPPYSSTIIAVTLVSRLLFTLPVSIWAKKRDWRLEEEVMPELKKAQAVASKVVYSQMSAAKEAGTKEQLKKTHAERVRKLVKRTRDELLRKHRCTTLPTVLIPAITQIPIFVGLSVVFNRACQRPTPLDSESFGTLTSLVHTDPTMTFPIILGLLTLANVESAKWNLSPERREREAKVEKWVAEKREKGEMVVRPANAIRTGLRLVSVARIIVGALVPGGVLVCWVTSAAFGLVQTWGFDWWERRRRLRLLPTSTTSSPPPSSTANDPQRKRS
ncbi:hypothetical protein PUNSTDRAFT_132531 [Punctularia strigosozonata HHB-11173 SS5]|uniref:uncharacterized protein n=1 Tax=Punctularia strigosozonata (strain HHB-11173) TaxID=741275 RepID=UPI0004416965|nr:uncharacterized protein PUNSTDRAFT_132531 [Punctularia strigosozonata HHB-11173 SS5]EIN10436.1 hypothetical protein PUNSTDRAFT_132531 [Punctularia strigosozonata HHB-11173 SS5]